MYSIKFLRWGIVFTVHCTAFKRGTDSEHIDSHIENLIQLNMYIIIYYMSWIVTYEKEVNKKKKKSKRRNFKPESILGLS